MAAVNPVAAVTDKGMTMLRCVGCGIMLGKNELRGGRAQGVTVGSKGVLKVDVFSCAPENASMAAVHPVADVTDKGMTMLRCVRVWNHAGQERIEGRQSSGGDWCVKGCFESGRPHVLTSLHQVWQLCI